MKPINWPRAVLAAVVANVLGFGVFVLLFGNPISRRILYSPASGQGDKFLSVWFELQPLPAVTPFWDEFTSTSLRKDAVLGLLLLWAFGLTLAYATVAESLPGRGWRKGLSFGVLLWVMGFFFFEVFFPFNILGEPFGLVLFELALELVVSFVFGVTIAFLYRPPRDAP